MAKRCATPEEFLKIVPEFSEEDTEVIQFWLDTTCSMINIECWGNKASSAHILLTAHFMAVEDNQEGGPTKRKKIDKLEIENAVKENSDEEFGSTKWGRLYLAMRRTVPFFGTVGRQILPMVPRRIIVT